MKLRFHADYRALLWSLLLFPLVPALAYARPALALWLLPLGVYLGYCAGVLTHNHVHTPVFVSKRVNALYSAWLSFFYGAPIFVWVPTHNQNHHRYLDGPGDLARTSAFAPRDSLIALLAYPSRSALAQLPEIARYVRSAFARKSAQRGGIVFQSLTLVFGQIAAFYLAVALHGLARGAFVYAVAIALPALFASWGMMFTNYVQHIGCDPASPDDHSRNFVSPVANWFVFNAGYHTVHHEHAGTHWSAYPALHAARAATIAPRLNARTIFGFCFDSYVLPKRAAEGYDGTRRIA